jgi:molybdopterin converting factor small subunit
MLQALKDFLMATVWIPALLRSLTAGQESVRVAGATLGELIDNLDRQFPGIKSKLCQGDSIRPGLSIVIDGQVARGGLSESAPENCEVHFIPAIAGGS